MLTNVATCSIINAEGKMKLSAYAKNIGVSYKTAWRMFHAGKIPGAYQLDTGTVIVSNPVIIGSGNHYAPGDDKEKMLEEGIEIIEMVVMKYYGRQRGRKKIEALWPILHK